MKTMITLLTLLISQFCYGQVLKGFISIENQSNHSLFLHDLILEKDQTIVVLYYQEQDFSSNYISINSPGSKFGYQLQTAIGNFDLIKAEGIAIAPQQQKVKKGERHRIKLYFPALPENITTFDLVEQQVPVEKSMNIYGISMSRSNTRNASIRFYEKADFIRYFKKNQGPYAKFEGFWTVSGDIKGEEEKTIADTVAIVFEDGYLKAYDLKGFEYGLKLRPHQSHLNVIHKIDNRTVKASRLKVGTTLRYKKRIKNSSLLTNKNSLEFYCMLQKQP